MGIIKKLTGAGKDVKKRDLLHTVRGTENEHNRCRKQYGTSKKLNIDLSYYEAISFGGIYVQGKIYQNVKYPSVLSCLS